jgi:hypothetical protein
MADDFYADTDGIDKHTPYMRELANRLEAVHSLLKATESDLWGCWGEDKTGEEFYAQYGDSSGRIHEAVHGAKSVFDSTSDGIGTMAKGLQDMEDTHVEATRRLAAESTDAGSAGTGSSGHGGRK